MNLRIPNKPVGWVTSKRQKICYSQVVSLCEFLNNRRDIATGFNNTSESRELHKQFWEEVALSLNSHSNGAVKTGKGWSKYWNDYKVKMRKLALSKSQDATDEGQANIRRITNIDRKFLDILGFHFTPALPVVEETQLEHNQLQELSKQIKMNISSPSEAHSEPIQSDGLESNISAPTSPSPPQDPLTLRPQPPQIIIRRVTSGRSPHDNHTPGPFAPVRVRHPSRPRDVSSPPAAQFASKAERSRRFRREQPMTFKMARRAIVVETQKQTSIQEKKLQIFGQLVQELGEIKEIIRTRYSIPTVHKQKNPWSSIK